MKIKAWICPIKHLGTTESMSCGYYSTNFKEMKDHIKIDHFEDEYLEAVLCMMKKNGKEPYDEWN